MSVNIQGSIVLITSSNASAPATDFGTGFVVYHDGQGSYVVTCAHVVSAVGGANMVLAAHKPASVVAIEDDIDIAILRVAGIQHLPPLPLQNIGEKGMPFSTAGFHLYDKPRYLIRSLSGTLGEQGGVETRDDTYRAKSWDLMIIDNYQLQRGYSGSPVVADSRGYAIGIVTNMEGNGQKGAARSVEAVSRVWPAMPASVFVAASAQRDVVASTQGDGGEVPEPLKGQPLNSKERHELMGLLRKCRSLSDANLRSIVVADLERDLDTTIQQTRSDTIVDIRYIVDACEYFDNFTSLIDAMKFFDQNAPSMLAVEVFLRARQWLV